MRAFARAIVLVIAGSAGAAHAADAVHVRGVVAAVDGTKITVHSREGKDVMLTLGESWKVAGVTKASMSDIKPGSFIGTANAEGTGGSATALEVVVFPEAMRGTGEGDRGWDLKPKSKMTNATVSAAVEGVDGRTVTLSYKGGQKAVTIAPDTPIVTVAGATFADVKPGVAVFVSGEPSGAGDMLQGGFIAVGKDGVIPPM